ncbi:MAG: glycosyltransferase [Burkholderiaceae bacterium]|nr:glycosyltransferase [Burkholderiaceae bacterium]
MSIVFLEESPTPIYARISKALGIQLVKQGHEVMMVKPSGFSVDSYRAFLQSRRGDSVYVSTAESNILQQKGEGLAPYFFEDFPGKLIFIHQDALLGGLSFENGLAKLHAWRRVASRSAHLCIEPDSVAALKGAGISRASLVPHASEFVPADCLPVGQCRHGASFVGHALPWGFQPVLAHSGLSMLVEGLMLQRACMLDTALHAPVTEWVERCARAFGDPGDTVAARIAHVHWIRHQFNLRSMAFRGRLLEEAQLPDLTVYGGDPAYLHRVERRATLGAGIRHEPAVHDEVAVQAIYRGTACSINITSLQFDHAVVNRVHDVFMSGGLCLTDARPGLSELTREHAEISWRDPAELREKVRYFSDPRHEASRQRLIRAVQADVMQRSGYPILAAEIEGALAQI